MKKLTFFSAVMDAGKSLKLIQDEYNYRKVGKRTLILKSILDTRDLLITTRFGNVSLSAIELEKEVNVFNLVFRLLKERTIDIVFIDEVQFLSTEQINQLKMIAIKLDISVYVYGLKTNFKTELFEGSKRLLEIADKVIELSSLCSCGKKAIFNARIDKKGRTILTGPEILCGDNDLYQSRCFSCYYDL